MANQEDKKKRRAQGILPGNLSSDIKFPESPTGTASDPKVVEPPSSEAVDRPFEDE